MCPDELCHEREWRDRWEGLLKDWKQLVCQATLNQFQIFLSSELIADPPDFQRVKEHLIAEQRGIQQRREELLEQVGALAPPKATRTIIYLLKATADKLHQELGKYTVIFVGFYFLYFR